MLGNQPALQTPGPQPPGIPQVAAAMGQAQPVRPPSKYFCGRFLCVPAVALHGWWLWALVLNSGLGSKLVFCWPFVCCVADGPMSMPTVPISRMQVSQGTFSSLTMIYGFKIIFRGKCWSSLLHLALGWGKLLCLPFSSIILCCSIAGAVSVQCCL